MTEHTITGSPKDGGKAHKSGDVKTADKYYTAILKAQLNHPDANHNMGVLAVGGKTRNGTSILPKSYKCKSKIEQILGLAHR